MKKKGFSIIGVAAFAVAVAVAINLNISANNNESVVTLANIEALASGEIGTGSICRVVTWSTCWWSPVPEDPYWFVTNGSFNF